MQSTATAIERQTAEFPGLERLSQSVYEIPYAELAPKLQERLRKSCMQLAGIETLEALKDMVVIAKQSDWHKAMTGRQIVLDAAEEAIARAEGRTL